MRNRNKSTLPAFWYSTRLLIRIDCCNLMSANITYDPMPNLFLHMLHYAFISQNKLEYNGIICNHWYKTKTSFVNKLGFTCPSATWNYMLCYSVWGITQVCTLALIPWWWCNDCLAFVSWGIVKLNVCTCMYWV